MLFALFSIIWLAVLMLSLSLCRAAALGDDVRAVRRPERIVIRYLDEHDEVLVGTAEQLPQEAR
jgi:predicted secreted protein